MRENNLKDIRLSDYNYNLPKEKIAKFPLEERKRSKLLIYNEGKIQHSQFYNIKDHLPEKPNLFFNDTRVIPARLHFKKDTGALIEIFLLEPYAPTTDVAEAMWIKGSCSWKCMVGNYKKWKDGQSLSQALNINGKEVLLSASIEDRGNQIIQFNWESDDCFVDVVEALGKIPLPPYIDREVLESDKERYQTVYSHNEGAVAAPTAGLHFSDDILKELSSQGAQLNYLTLHVSAGTFQPIKEENVLEHPMHSEQVVVTLENVRSIINNSNVIPVGTTSMRTLESLYWFGVMLKNDNQAAFKIEKLYPYQHIETELPSTVEAFKNIEEYMLNNQLEKISGTTEIFIFPGYTFRVCKGIVTNFHLPGSTLILLIAALIGEDWRKVYQQALDENYRFLSYGDSSLLIP